MLIYLDPIWVKVGSRSKLKVIGQSSRSQDAANLVIVVFCRHLQIQGDVFGYDTSRAKSV